MGRRYAEVRLTLAPGAEPWVIVSCRGKSFKLPGDAPILDALQGALEGWLTVPRTRRAGSGWVRVSLAEWAAMEALRAQQGVEENP